MHAATKKASFILYLNLSFFENKKKQGNARYDIKMKGYKVKI